MIIKHKATLVLAAASIAFSPLVNAQTDRAAVKAETKAANKNGGLHQGESPNVQGKLSSDRTRADRKSETQSLAKQGQLTSKGETGSLQGISETPKSTADRQTVKAETRRAVKAGEIPSGEK